MYEVYGDNGIVRVFDTTEEAFAFADHLEECGIKAEVCYSDDLYKNLNKY